MSEFELIGKLTKQEKVRPIKNNKLPNTFVIAIPSPVAAYYNRFGHEDKPDTILVITKNPVSFENILRTTHNINTKYGLNIDGAKSEIIIGRRKFNGIRLRGFKQFSEIPEVQKYFKDHGFEFSKEVRIKDQTDSLIRVNKFFRLEKVEDQLYRSSVNKDRYYFEIPKDIPWEQFRDLTFDVKNNVSGTGFDIAKGIFYHKDGITDVIRIIKPDIDLELVKEVHQKYLDRLSQ